MKNIPLIFSAIALVAVIVLGSLQFSGKGAKNESSVISSDSTAVSGSVVYYNLDKIIQDYDMANELRSAVQSKVEGITAEVTRRGNKLQNDMNSFQEKINKGLITRSVAEVQGQKLQQQQAEFQNYAAQKDQEIAEEQQVLINQIGDAIHTFLQKYNEEKNYAMIIATTGDILPQPVSVGDPALDITEDILAGLNAEYVKSKSENK